MEEGGEKNRVKKIEEEWSVGKMGEWGHPVFHTAGLTNNRYPAPQFADIFNFAD
jgi:hypothetical protein